MDEVYIDDVILTRYFMMYIEEYELAAMADFHLGYEDVMASKGLFLPHIQREYIMKMLEKIYEKYSPKKFLIDGDLKHEFSRNMPQEWKEIEEVIDYISERSELIVVRGNHDNFLRSILRRRGVELKEEYRIGKFLFIHGHREHEILGTTVIGHEHPSITLRDEIGSYVKLPCFLYSPELIVLPAVSIYASGTDITKNDFISPVLKKYEKNMKVFAIDEEEGIIPTGDMQSFTSQAL